MRLLFQSMTTSLTSPMLLPWESLICNPTRSLERVKVVPAQFVGTTFTRSSDLVGLQIKDSQGNNIGEVKDVVIDWKSSRIAYAVVAPTGISELNNKYLAIPATAL